MSAVERFNPHARKGRDGKKLRESRKSRVSIHTPVRGVTAFCQESVRPHGFNPHARKGRDADTN